MKILLSNDDGVHASGINFLYEELCNSFDTLIIAPNKERSSCGHGVTLGEPIRVKQLKENIYECSGYPADCILVGLGQICKDDLPDLVVSGINHGANLGQDRFYSGTIAAAREAAFRRIPSIAISLVTLSLKDVEHFNIAAKFIKKLIKADIHNFIPPLCVLNINVPNISEEEISGARFTFAGYQNYSEEVVKRTDTRGKEYYWVGGTYKGPDDIPGSDGNAIREGYISLDLQSLTGTEPKMLMQAKDRLKELIEKLE